MYFLSLQSVRWFAAVYSGSLQCTAICCRVYSGLLQSVQWFAAECTVVCCRVYGCSLQRVRRFAAESTAVCCREYGGLLQSVWRFAAECTAVRWSVQRFAAEYYLHNGKSPPPSHDLLLIFFILKEKNGFKNYFELSSDLWKPHSSIFIRVEMGEV